MGCFSLKRNLNNEGGKNVTICSAGSLTNQVFLAVRYFLSTHAGISSNMLSTSGSSQAKTEHSKSRVAKPEPDKAECDESLPVTGLSCFLRFPLKT